MKAIELGVTSVTIYRLEVRPDQPLMADFLKSPQSFPNEQACLEMRCSAKRLLEQAGYQENLIGWFLKDQAADTVVYRERWQNQSPCVAFGPGVHNYGADHFYYNFTDQLAYIDSVSEGIHPTEGVIMMGPQEQMVWFVMCQLKSKAKVSRFEVERRYGVENEKRLEEWTKPLQEMGLLIGNEEGVKLSEEGSCVLEWCIQDLLEQLKGWRCASGR